LLIKLPRPSSADPVQKNSVEEAALLENISESIAVYEKVRGLHFVHSWNLPAPKRTITRLNVEELV
jgi:hypothetical protein